MRLIRFMDVISGPGPRAAMGMVLLANVLLISLFGRTQAGPYLLGSNLTTCAVVVIAASWDIYRSFRPAKTTDESPGPTG